MSYNPVMYSLWFEVRSSIVNGGASISLLRTCIELIGLLHSHFLFEKALRNSC